MGLVSHSNYDKKKMELGEDGLKTLECLRGRLLAERHASKVANDKADLLQKKVMELEKKIKEEIKLRENAEKKLERLMKKLESFTLEGSSSGFSCISSTSGPKDPEESDSNTTQNTCNSNSLLFSTPMKLQWENPNAQMLIPSENTTLKTHELSSSEVKMEKMRAINGGENEKFFGNKPMAFAPVTPLRATTISRSSNTKANELDSVNRSSVSEVLDALRLVRERIQSSIGRAEKAH